MSNLEVSVRDGCVPMREGQTLFEALKELGIDAIEMDVLIDGSVPHVNKNSDEQYSIGTPEELAKLKAKLQSEGVKVAALLLGTDFAGDNAEENVQWAIRAIKAAKELGAPAVRIDTATRNTALSVEEVAENFVEKINRVLSETEETGVGLGIENHGHISNDPRFLDGVFAKVNNPRLGMTLDTGNFYWFGTPLSQLYGIIEKYAPHARHTHMKSINYDETMRDVQRETGYQYGELCCALDEGNIDMKRAVQLLKDAGYKGTLCIENESLPRYDVDTQFDIIRRDAQTLRNAQ